MKKEDFSRLRFFTYDEKNHKGRYLFHSDKILEATDLRILIVLDQIRAIYNIGETITILCTYDTSPVHTPNSWHSQTPCHAVDFYYNADLKYWQKIEQIETALNKLKLENTVGFGIYPNSVGQSFHLDLRGSKARWAGWFEFDKDGKRTGTDYNKMSYEKAKQYLKENNK